MEKNLIQNTANEIDIHYMLSGKENILPLMKTIVR